MLSRVSASIGRLAPLTAARLHSAVFALARDPSKLKYTNEHEWLEVKGDVATVGVTAYAANKLGEIVHVDFSDAPIGESKAFMDAFAVLDSTKAAASVYAPVAGEIVECNTALAKNAAAVSSSPLDDGWLVKMKVSAAGKADIAKLMDLKAYEKFIAETDH
eukprot:c22170_g1_i1.p3 GENE.c22170_g1_i1~~c22170_g1_i1.p3  ORF type:complete len:161 (-),score=40.97 c22170_g1_i1:50-532(-)